MDMRVRDETRFLKEMKSRQNEARKTLAGKYGKNSMKYKRSITRMNRMCKLGGKKEDKKHELQLHHLKRKHGEAREARGVAGMKRKYQTKWKEKFEGV